LIEFESEKQAMLPEYLIVELRARIADPKNRSDAVAAFQEILRDEGRPGPEPTRVSIGHAAGDGAFGGLLQQVAGALSSGRGFNPQELAEQVAEDIRTGKTSMEDVFGDTPHGAGIEIHDDEDPSDAPHDLLPPASQEDITAAESALGFSLPEDLKQLYTTIANGGFGPGAGFPPLAALAARYRDFCSEPQGPCDEMWPEHLLPLIPIDIYEDCYDLKTGKIVRWDPEELIDEESEEGAWERSFIPRADSLADWLMAWLARKPMSEQLAEQLENGLLENVRISIDHLRKLTPAERAAMGLPEEGWEAQVCRNHGVDPKKLL
jgi:hypothetical protein